MGAAARFGLGVAVPHLPGRFPWSTFLVNVTGCLALGFLMLVVIEVAATSRYARPFLAVGFLGGYTTFSTYALEARDLLVLGRPGLAAIYVFGSVVAGLLAVWIGACAARLTLARGVSKMRTVRERAHNVDAPPYRRRGE